MTDPVNRETVRQFITTIAAQAKAALNGIEKPGYLQMTRLHPTSEQLVPSRYRLDDAERMITDAVADAQAGHNVYLEARTIREDAARGNGRGKLEDTAAVFALVIDSDADKNMGWTAPATVHPSMTVATSPGNFQFWFFLETAVDPAVAQKLGERIRHAANSDHDTGNPTQPYRVAGTANYPNDKKIKRGRITVPTTLTDFNPEALCDAGASGDSLPAAREQGKWRRGCERRAHTAGRRQYPRRHHAGDPRRPERQQRRPLADVLERHGGAQACRLQRRWHRQPA